MTSPTIDEFVTNPHAVNHQLRATAPITWVDVLGGWIVTTRDLAIEVMRDAELFTVDDPRFSTGQVVGPSMLSLDGPQHTRHRSPFADGYRRSGFRDRLGRFITARARALVNDVVADGAADLRAVLAGPLAVEVMTESLGLDVDPTDLLRVYQAIVSAVEALSAGVEGAADSADAVMTELTAVVQSAIQGGAPLLAEVSAELDPHEVVSNVAVVLFGGVETSDAMITNVLWHLLSHPEAFDQVRQDRSLVAGAVEESLRLEPAATRVDRYVTRDARVAGVNVAKGDLVIVSLAAANRDPDVFRDPDSFEVERPESRLNITFAQGPHVCLASHVARAEAVAAVEAVLDGLKRPRLSADAGPPTGLVFRKPDHLPVLWDVA